MSRLTSFFRQTGLRTRSCRALVKERYRPLNVDSAHFVYILLRISLYVRPFFFPSNRIWSSALR